MSDSASESDSAGTTRSLPVGIDASPAEAAGALGMSIDSFERYVQPELRLVRRGKLRLIPVAEIERWLRDNASRALDRGDVDPRWDLRS